jgi:hypothetical protein
VEIVVNVVEFLVSVGAKVVEFCREGGESVVVVVVVGVGVGVGVGVVVGVGVGVSVVEMYKMVLEAEGDVGGGLNDGLNELCDVFIFDGEKVVASRGLLESGKRHGVGDEGLASV